VTPGLTRAPKESPGVTSAVDEREGSSPIYRRRTRPFRVPASDNRVDIPLLFLVIEGLMVSYHPAHSLHLPRRGLSEDGSPRVEKYSTFFPTDVQPSGVERERAGSSKAGPFAFSSPIGPSGREGRGRMGNKVRVGERNEVRIRVLHRGIIDRATARIATGTRGGSHGISHGGEHRLATATFTPARAAPRRQQQPGHRDDSVQMAQMHEVFSISREAPGGGPTPPSLRTAASRLDPARRHNEKRMIRHRDYAARSP
jgi:hypothetical protein